VQDPAPPHTAWAVAIPPTHDAAPHTVPLPGWVHAFAFVPSQEPPHADPSLAHAARAPCGWPETGTQVPTEPATSQAWHCPSHAWSQQTPSVQKPLAQSDPVEQLPPEARANVAVTDLAASIDTTQAPLPLQLPDHPVNVHPGAGEADSPTTAPLANSAEQVAPHAMPPGADVTSPDPTFVTLSVQVPARRIVMP
jgi:hypothetical protein